jgi:acyl-CoA synthetase (NDP forming)/GNAT superfamily N-acetyltransferase
VTDHPAHREADVVLGDGGTVHLRPIRAGDADAILALHARFSERTRYLRYFSPYPRIPERDLKRFTEVDHHRREALVAELSGRLIAVGRYESLSADEAEVAFVVEDAHQRRGLGSVLLEHLAAAAREERIARFVAEVLPENGTMLRVFSDAGYTVDRSYADGVVHLTFEIAPTRRSVEVARDRERRTEARSIARLLAPRAVAVVGASTRPRTIGNTLLRNLTSGGFTGPVYPIHPTARTVRGLPAYATVAAAPGPVDLAVVAVPAPAVPAVVSDCAAAGVYGLVVVSAGFGEEGPEGLARQRALVAAARAGGMRVVGPNCLGIVDTDPAVRLNATLAPALPDPGRAGFFSQSGALGVALLAEAHRRGLGLSTFVSAGNRADVSGNDLLQYWLDDPHTDKVLLYLETFGNPRKFARLARRLARRKPVIAVARPTRPAIQPAAGGQVGRPPAGGREGRSAAVGQAGRPVAFAGLGPAPDEGAVEALFAQSGVIRVDTVAELFDVGVLLAHQPLPGGSRVGVVGNSTALGTLAVDACHAAGLEVPTRYPVDVGPTATARAFATALRRAARDDDVDALVAVFVPPLAVPTAAYAEVLVTETAGGTRPVVATFVAGDLDDNLTPTSTPGPGTVPSYGSVEEAVRALGRMVRYARWRREPAGHVPVLPDVDPAAAHRWLVDRLAGGSGPQTGGTTLDEVTASGTAAAGTTATGTTAGGNAAGGNIAGGIAAGGITLVDSEAVGLLTAYGIVVEDSVRVGGADEAVAAAERLGYPVAVKVADGPLRHRLDLGGVRLDLDDADDVRRAYREMATRFGAGPGAAPAVGPGAGPGVGPGAGPGVGTGAGPGGGLVVAVQRMRPPGTGCVVDLVEDPAFGPVIGFGLAGVATDLFGDHAWRAAPLTAEDAAALVRAPLAAPLLVEPPAADLAALEDLVVRLGLLADEQPEVRAVQLNPVLAAADGAAILHATVHIGQASARPDTGPRRMR